MTVVQLIPYSLPDLKGSGMAAALLADRAGWLVINSSRCARHATTQVRKGGNTLFTPFRKWEAIALDLEALPLASIIFISPPFGVIICSFSLQGWFQPSLRLGRAGPLQALQLMIIRKFAPNACSTQ